jgi:C4-dicarboxylate-specific signal transduction histidine kinase
MFTNLLQNSIDALEGMTAPTITISFRQEDDQIITNFSDSGKGLPAHLAEKIFEPFFTTKDTGKGTGLGLSIVYGIISEFKGTIECDASPGKGCSFLISLPISN